MGLRATTSGVGFLALSLLSLAPLPTWARWLALGLAVLLGFYWLWLVLSPRIRVRSPVLIRHHRSGSDEHPEMKEWLRVILHAEREKPSLKIGSSWEGQFEVEQYQSFLTLEGSITNCSLFPARMENSPTGYLAFRGRPFAIKPTMHAEPERFERGQRTNITINQWLTDDEIGVIDPLFHPPLARPGEPVHLELDAGAFAMWAVLEDLELGQVRHSIKFKKLVASWVAEGEPLDDETDDTRE
jgi:hypothetical protein